MYTCTHARTHLRPIQDDDSALAALLVGLPAHDPHQALASLQHDLEDCVPRHHVRLSPAGEAFARREELQCKHARAGHVEPVDVLDLYTPCGLT